MGAEPLSLVISNPDAEIAAEIRQAVTAKLLELCEILTDATQKGFQVAYGTGPSNAAHDKGRQIITMITVAKHF